MQSYPEIGAETSGGGFSNYFQRPGYQDLAVTGFLINLGSQNEGLFSCVHCPHTWSVLFLLCDRYSTSGRGYPDVAAQYYNYTSIFNGTVGNSAGSSAATTVRLPPSLLTGSPLSSINLNANMQVFASIIVLLNDFLLSRKEPPLGFLNPWLYGMGQTGLTDITSGSNPGCSTNGFSADFGWDPVRPARLMSLHYRCWLIQF
jgi:tripeptidyl-peptidase-1